jgi:hypothetical protein
MHVGHMHDCVSRWGKSRKPICNTHLHVGVTACKL